MSIAPGNPPGHSLRLPVSLDTARCVSIDLPPEMEEAEWALMLSILQSMRPAIVVVRPKAVAGPMTPQEVEARR